LAEPKDRIEVIARLEKARLETPDGESEAAALDAALYELRQHK